MEPPEATIPIPNDGQNDNVFDVDLKGNKMKKGVDIFLKSQKNGRGSRKESNLAIICWSLTGK